MAGLVPAIYVFASLKQRRSWMAGPSPVMTKGRDRRALVLMVFRQKRRQSWPRARDWPKQDRLEKFVVVASGH